MARDSFTGVYYIVRKTTTRCMSLSYNGNLRILDNLWPKAVVAAWGDVNFTFLRSCQSVQVICGLCFVLTRPREHGLETSALQMYFWKSGFKFANGRNKKRKVFGILSQWKNWVTLMMCMHKTFLAVRNDLLLPQKILVTEDGDISFIH